MRKQGSIPSNEFEYVDYACNQKRFKYSERVTYINAFIPFVACFVGFKASFIPFCYYRAEIAMFCDLSSVPLEFKWKEKRLVLQQQQLKVMATINAFVSI